MPCAMPCTSHVLSVAHIMVIVVIDSKELGLLSMVIQTRGGDFFDMGPIPASFISSPDTAD